MQLTLSLASWKRRMRASPRSQAWLSLGPASRYLLICPPVFPDLRYQPYPRGDRRRGSEQAVHMLLLQHGRAQALRGAADDPVIRREARMSWRPVAAVAVAATRRRIWS